MIGYYVHHHGRGHRHRMRRISARLAALGHPVTGLSSSVREPKDPTCWVQLPRDDQATRPVDPTGRGRFHWVPQHDPGIAARAARIAAWVVEQQPSVLVVDVSVETAVLARLCGVPVVVVAQPGRREDAAHVLAYDLAARLIAPWPEQVQERWPEAWIDKTSFVGAISRFDGWPNPVQQRSSGGGRGLLLWGAGGDGSGERVLDSLRHGVADWHWEVAGPAGRVLGERATWHALAQADVVVTHAGQNSVAEVAAARRRAVVLADERPFDEQHHTVERLDRAGLAATATGCPRPDQWPRLLECALRTDPERWALWSSGDGAGAAAQAIAAVARAGEVHR